MKRRSYEWKVMSVWNCYYSDTIENLLRPLSNAVETSKLYAFSISAKLVKFGYFGCQVLFKNCKTNIYYHINWQATLKCSLMGCLKPFHFGCATKCSGRFLKGKVSFSWCFEASLLII